MLRVEDGEMQSVHLRASVGIRVTIQIVAALGIGVPVAGSPSIAVALGDGKDRVLRVEDGEVQSVHLCASVGIRVAIQIGAALGIGVPVAGRPGVAVALSDGGGSVLGMIDDQMQRDDAVASRGGSASDGKGRGGGVIVVGVSVPGVTFASRDGLHALRRNAGPYDDSDGCRLAAASVGGSSHGIGGRGGRCDSDGAVVTAVGPDIGIGTVSRECGVLIEMYESVARYAHYRNGLDGQMQGDDAVAAGDGPSEDCVGRSAGAGGVGGPVPGVAAASSDGLYALSRDAVAHGDGDAGGLTGAPVSIAGHGIGGGDGRRHGDGGPALSCGPYIGAGAVCSERGVFIEMDGSVARDGHHRAWLKGEIQGVDLRASVGIYMAMQIGATLGVGLSVAVVPGVAAALGDVVGRVLRVVDGEVEGDDAVAAGGGPAGDCVGRGAGAGGVSVPVPGVATASGDGLHALSRDAVAHGDGDADGLTGAAVGGAGDGIGGGAGGRDGDGAVVAAV